MGERESEDQTLSGQHGSMSQDVHRAAPLRTLLLGQLHTDADQDLQRAALLRTLLLGQLHTNADDDNGGAHDDRWNGILSLRHLWNMHLLGICVPGSR